MLLDADLAPKDLASLDYVMSASGPLDADVRDAFDQWRRAVGVHAAAALSLDPNQVFKTLVTRGGKNGLFVFCIPVGAELDLKKCAKCAGVKSLEMIHVKELISLTGYMRGGCSPIGMKKQYPTFIDSTASDFEKIYVSAGQRGLQLCLDPKELAAFVGAELCDVTA